MPETLTFASLVPRAAAVVEMSDEQAASALPEEQAALGRASGKRRRDFAVGRECARRALRKLGLDPVPILRGAAREPLWPAGICGSITHCEGYGAAVVARRTDIRGIGIDAELRKALPEGVFERVAVDAERRWISGADARIPWDVLLFSAKESVFKAWFPVVGTWLGFQDARIEFDQPAGAFRAIILPGAPLAECEAPSDLAGRFHVDPERVLTSAFIPASLRRSPPTAQE
jgi:4'-phosphopantetheinyl transferase EntD